MSPSERARSEHFEKFCRGPCAKGPWISPGASAPHNPLLRLQRFEVRTKYPLDLGDRVRVEESFMTKRDNRFRFRAMEVATRVGDHAIGP